MRHFLVLGQTGVGKSSLINTAFGAKFAETGDFEPHTAITEFHCQTSTFGEICLIDTPGLGDDVGSDADRKYLCGIRDAIRDIKIDAVLYVTRLTETRLRPYEKRSLELIMKELSNDALVTAWLVFTFAASVPSRRRDDAVNMRTEQICRFLRCLMPSFIGFSNVIMIDNVSPNWDDECVALDDLLLTTACDA